MDNIEKNRGISDVPSIAQFKQMYSENPEETVRLIAEVKQNYTLNDLRAHWGYKSTNGVYVFFKKYLGDGRKTRKYTRHETVRTQTEKINSDFELKYNSKKEKGKIINDKILNLVSILNEDGNYEVIFNIKELK